MIQNFIDLINNLAIFDQIFLVLFCTLFFIRFLYLFLFTGRILFRKKDNTDHIESNPLTLILTVRNQEQNLKNNIPGILSNETVDFDMVVVDDYSQDSSFLVLGLLKDRYKKLQISHLNQETRYSNKLAQNIALKAATHDWVLTAPVSISEFHENWLSDFSQNIAEKNNVVLGYSSVQKAKGMYNLLYRIENYFQYVRSTGFIQNGIPLVYSEENVAFRKDKYFEKGGFGKKITEQYANLELLINLFIQKNTTTILFDKRTAVFKSEQVSGIEYFELLRKRFRIESHLSYFKRVFLRMEEISKLLLIPYAIVVIVLYNETWPVVAVLLSLKLLANLFIIKIAQNRLNERKIFIPSLVYDLIMPYFKLFYRWRFNQQSKTKGWWSKV